LSQKKKNFCKAILPVLTASPLLLQVLNILAMHSSLQNDTIKSENSIKFELNNHLVTKTPEGSIMIRGTPALSTARRKDR